MVGYPWDRGRLGNFYLFIFCTLFLSHFIFVILFFVILFCFILFLTAINLLMFLLVRKKIAISFSQVSFVFKFGGRSGLCTLQLLIPWYCISCHIGDNVSFKFRGVEKYTVFLFVLFVCFVCFCL